MPFGLCNAPGTFQRCMVAIFHDMIEKTMEVFMDDFLVFGDSFSSCLTHLDNMLQRCEDTNLVLNWEKCHFMVKEGIVLGHKISKNGIEVDRAKVDVIAKLPHPTTVKGIRSFLGHAGFYRRFIQDFSKIARPMTHLLEKETPFIFSKECVNAFETLKKKLTEGPILVAPDWDLPFEIMCDASDFAIGAVLGQQNTKHFQPIHYASKTMTDAQAHYTTTGKELLAVVYAFEKFRPYLVLSKKLLNNKDKILDLTKTPVNENCSVVILKKFPKKLGDPGRFLIPCDFLEMDVCLALPDLGASIKLMPLSIWKKLSLPDLTRTRMILELADRSISTPTGIAEDVFVKVGTFFFQTYFVVVDYVADPRVPLILGRPFLRTERSLIDVHGEQMTLRHDDQSVTFKVGDTKLCSYNTIESVNQIDVIDVACDEFVQEVLRFSNISESGNPTTTLESILCTSPPSLTLFRGGEFMLEEIEGHLADNSFLPEIDDADCDSEGDLLLLEKYLNNYPISSLPPKEQKIEELKTIESSRLKDEDKTALLKVLRSHKHAIAWKISDIKGINPQFCTHKILMEEDAKPTVQHQRRVNPKIHKVIKQEVIKLLDAGLIYPIFDSPWVSLVHCVPKKGGMTVVTNEENELIPIRLITG
ncbi:reverse transcriptase domain-containing protein [Tanacetum coccineum]